MVNLFKKVFASVAAMAVVATSANLGAIVAAQNVSAEFTAAFTWMKEKGITSMATEDAYMPYNAVTREQGAALIVRALKVAGVELTLDPNATCSFGDANKIDPTLVDAVNEACSYGLIKGYGGNFRPTEVMTRAMVMTVLGRALYGQQPEPAQYWSNYYALLNADGIFTIENAFNNVMRYELGLVLYRIAVKMGMEDGVVSGDDNLDNILCQLLGTCDDTTNDNTDTGDNVDVPVGEVEGSLHVSLSPATPVGGFVPGNGSNISVMKVDFLAGEDPIRLDAVSVSLEGFASRNNFSNVKLVDEDGVKLTNERSFTSDYKARLVFEKDFVIPANGVKSAYLYVETQNSTNEVFNLAIMMAEDIEANTVDVSGPFPIRSNSFQTTSYSSTTLTFDADFTGADTSKENRYVGNTNEQFGKFKLTVGSQNNRNVAIKRVTLRSVDTVEGVLDNFRLAMGADSNVVQKVIVDGKYVTFIFKDDFVMNYGDSKTFYIYADVVGGELNDTVNFYLDRTSDVSAFEVDTNASVSIAINSNEKYLEGYAIQEGDSLITRRSDSPASTFIANDSDYVDVLIANVFLSAAIDVDRVRVYAEGNSIGSSDIERVRLYINGKQVDETSTYVGTSPTGYYEFSVFDTLQGSNEFIVKVDTINTATDGNTFKATLKAESIAFTSNAEYVASKNTVQTSDLNGQAAGGTMTIKTPALTSVTRTDSNGSSEQVVAGANDFEALTFVLQANNVTDLRVNGFKVVVSSGSSSNVSQVAVYVGGELVDTKSINGGSATFSSLGINVPAGGTTEVTILATINSSYPAGNQALEFTVNTFDVDDDKGNSLTTEKSVVSALFDVIASATLLADLDTDSPDEQVITAGQLYEVASFQLESKDDNGIIQELAFMNVPSTFTSGSVSTGSEYPLRLTGSNSADGALMYIYDEDGNQLGSATLTDGVLHFTFATAVELPRDNGGSTFVIKAMPKYITTASASNTTIRLAFLEPGVTVGSSIRTFITSDANGDEITTATINNAISKTQYVRKTALVMGNVTAPTGRLLTNGIGFELFKFQAATNNSEKAKVRQFRFSVEL